jgi:microcystin-dependent protein
MAEPFLSEIRIFGFNFAPKGWAFCNGQILPINQNQALFALLGTTYGGDGRTTFALPDLKGRIPLHFGTSNFGDNFNLGQRSGEENHTLIASELPAHNHSAQASSAAANQSSPSGTFWANSGSNQYSSTAGTTMNAQALSGVGGSQPHNNMPPFLTLSFCISLAGIFPSRN